PPQGGMPAMPDSWKSMPTAPQAGGMPGVTPGQSFDMNKAISIIDKMPMSDDQKYATLEQWSHIASAQNKERLDEFRIQTQLDKEKLAWEKDRRAQLEKELADARADKRIGIAERAADRADRRADATIAHLARIGSGGAGGAAQGKP